MPRRQLSWYMSAISSGVHVLGRLTVLLWAHVMSGWIAAIILMWPIGVRNRVDVPDGMAQSKTGMCSAWRPGAPSMLPCSSTCLQMASTESSAYPRPTRASRTPELTIFISPPPTRLL
ncbi:MAG: hypothetical protein BWY99_02172 [Synergistetes bacterium ADurb.BinA166]|nr:MAG: hypothetical protein BWY99_02172 [Synergistetes bacterium ADurb.BinA166]